ncbi:origin recognition complex subunit 6 [Chaetomium sp. MPI-CAGE-AT-0009]|nr:origin recognition complex subunit 6 [Chaetomium sp. MPI-CAGE-AT-0009]
MNRSIEQTLLSLLPTHNSDLPESLTQLASSLLAQSRNRASTLKAEEEVARLYACANLACDRLKITLNLPPIDPRPPIPPRIYKRLYNHLDKILPATASTPSRHTPGGTALGSGRPTTDAWARANATAVLGALYLFVWRGVEWPGGSGVERERYVGMRREVVGVLGRVRREVRVVGDGEEEAWEGWREVGVAELDAAALRGNRHGWFEMGWVSGVGDLVDREAARVQDEEEEEGREGGEGVGEVVQIRRADTMFQERYDYLGERKRKAYAEWKEGVLKRIKELEAR